MKSSYILKIGIISVIFLIILTSGCTGSSTNETKTFSDDAMSFNYPDFFTHKLVMLMVHLSKQ